MSHWWFDLQGQWQWAEEEAIGFWHRMTDTPLTAGTAAPRLISGCMVMERTQNGLELQLTRTGTGRAVAMSKALWSGAVLDIVPRVVFNTKSQLCPHPQ